MACFGSTRAVRRVRDASEAVLVLAGMKGDPNGGGPFITAVRTDISEPARSINTNVRAIGGALRCVDTEISGGKQVARHRRVKVPRAVALRDPPLETVPENWM